MFDIIKETFLSEYFLFESVVGELYDRRTLFKKVGGIFSYSIKETDTMFSLVDNEDVKEIETLAEYNRYCRMREYGEMTGRLSVDPISDAVIAIKGSALKTLAANKLKTAKTDAELIKKLTSLSENGCVTALKISGVLNLEGIIFDGKKKEVGLKRLKKAALWSDLFGALGFLKYSDDKETAAKILNSAAKNTSLQDFAANLSESYGVKRQSYDENVLLLKRAFVLGKFNRDRYESIVERLLFSEVIGQKNKEQIIFSENKALLADACDLPLRLKLQNLVLNEKPFFEMPFYRKDEVERFILGFSKINTKNSGGYNSLCFYSESDFVLEAYLKAVEKSLFGAKIDRINVADLSEADFELTKNNVFLRSLNEDKNNVLLIVMKGEINGGIEEQIKKFLSADKREKFYLKYPALAINLSSVCPICFCDKRNAEKIADANIEKIRLSAVSSSERKVVIEKTIANKCKDVSSDVKFSEECIEKLFSSNVTVETINFAIDKALRLVKCGEVTAEVVIPFLKEEKEKSKFGF